MTEPQQHGDPWRNLEPPTGDNPITGSRVDASHPWNLFWALDTDNKPSLALGHSVDFSQSRLPRVRSLTVRHEPSAEPGASLILLTLTDPSLRDVFARLCLDIVNRTRECRTEAEACAVMVRRTWRWHHLLAGGGDDRLSAQRQLGLLGELAVLDRLVLPNMPTRAAIEGWVGPERAPKDFELGRVSIEAKANRSDRVGQVRISSLEQLDRTTTSNLFLCVTEIAPSGADPGVTVTSESDRVRERLVDLDATVVDLFDSKLEAAGLSDDHDYGDSQWIIGDTSVFEVSEEFPRIDPTNAAAAIKKVRYMIEIDECEAFLLEHERIAGLLADGARDE